MRPSPTLILTALYALLFVFAVGCSDDRGESPPDKTAREDANSEASTPQPPSWTTDPARTTPSAIPVENETIHGYTYGDATGNRVVEGAGRLPGATPIDVPLAGTPLWVVGAPLGADTGWVVAYDDGRIDAFRLDGASDEVKPWPTSPSELPSGAPPAVAVEGERLRLLTALGDRGSALTHPIDTRTGTLAIDRDGTLLADPGEASPLTALPDARIVESADGTVAVLSTPTERYVHGVIGDGLEAANIGVLRPEGGGYEQSGEVLPESGGVFEALAPLWFRSAEGEDELLAVTESAEGVGTRVSVYAPDGELVAAGPFIGTSQKWRHLIAAGPFGPNGETEIAVTRTPHVDPVTEFHRLDRESGEIRISATSEGYPSHTIYSRNLDAARAGDLDGDGVWELLVPDESYAGLVALRHEERGVEESWRLPIGGTLSTNIGSATDEAGRVAIAVGTADGVLRIWR